MSLIHEALEKVEQEKKDPSLPRTVISEAREKIRPKENSQVIYGIVIALVLCFILGMIYFLVGSPPEKSASPPATAAIFSRPNQGRFVLTGVTWVGKDPTAIINNELVRVGDGVSGAKVVRIEEQEVTLDERGQTITLSL